VFEVATVIIIDVIFDIMTWNAATGELTISEDDFAFCILNALAVVNVRLAD
jgi:hypothetical protein